MGRRPLVINVGTKFGKMTVLSEGPRLNGRAAYLCMCECGKTRLIQVSSLVSSPWDSCKSHSIYPKKTYRVWISMKTRCYNKKHQNYRWYGGKGIRIDAKWKKFSQFYEHMGDCPAGMTIDRIDPSKGYSKENCRWANSQQQARSRTDNRWIEFNGKLQIVQDWAIELGIPSKRILTRLNAGWPLERVLAAVKFPALIGGRKNIRRLTFNGKTQTLKQWDEELGFASGRIYKRIRMGWPIEKVLSPRNFLLDQYHRPQSL